MASTNNAGTAPPDYYSSEADNINLNVQNDAPTNTFVNSSDENVIISQGVEADIDSALLAGMREPRERVALLRLENALLDFMKSDNEWLEVGGPYNSIVLLPSNIKEENGNTIISPIITSCNANGYRQTSFQKCILHRLADRFGIIREPGVLMFGSIRLLKLSRSAIPSRLLQDLEPADYNNCSTHVYDSRQFYDNASPHNNKAPAIDNTQVNDVTRSLADTSLGIVKDGANSNIAKNRKIKIMKRPPKDSQHNSDLNNAKNLLRKSSSELPEKEKEYAKARARIFQEETMTTDMERTSRAICTSDLNVLANSEFLAETSNDSLPHSMKYEDRLELGKDNQARTLETTGRKVSNGSLHHLEPNMPISQHQGILEDQSYVSSSLSALETKAVYRNREEEAADPDFRRHRASAAIPAPSSLYGVNVTTPGPLHATNAGTRYGVQASTSQWTPSSHYNMIQQQKSAQSVPFYGATRPSYHQQPHHPQFFQQHHQYQYPSHQAQRNSTDHVQHQTSNIQSVAGHFSKVHHSNSNKDYTARYGTSVGATGKSRHQSKTNTLTAAAPAFYPPSLTASSEARMFDASVGDGSVK